MFYVMLPDNQQWDIAPLAIGDEALITRSPLTLPWGLTIEAAPATMPVTAVYFDVTISHLEVDGVHFQQHLTIEREAACCQPFGYSVFQFARFAEPLTQSIGKSRQHIG